MVWSTCDSKAFNSSCTAVQQETVGKPYAGNPHVRFEEGEQLTLLPTQLPSVDKKVLFLEAVIRGSICIAENWC